MKNSSVKKKTKPNIWVFFDTETAEITSSEPLDFPEKLTVTIKGIEQKRRIVNVRPYAIGWLLPNSSYFLKRQFRERTVEDSDESYRRDVGFEPGKDGELFLDFSDRCVDNFISYVYALGEKYRVHLVAYNVTYDFSMIAFEFVKRFGDLCTIKSILGGGILIKGRISIKIPTSKYGRRVSIVFEDLWQWQKARGLQKWIAQYIKDFKKIELNYAKRDIKYRDGLPYEYTDADTGEVKAFELEKEREYLKEDILWLPVIFKDIKKQRERGFNTVLRGLDISWGKRKRLISTGITQSGFYKALAGETIGHGQHLDTSTPFDYTFRPTCTITEYQTIRGSFLGGFTSGGKFYKWKGKNDQLALFIDVNSMYPYIMKQGLPYGETYEEEPDEPYVIWYLLKGNESPKWKEKYDVFDNTFLGKSFFERPWHKREKAWTILKELYDLMCEMCTHSFQIVGVEYQLLGKHITPFIEDMYELKKTYNSPKDKVEELIRESAKVGMNSMFGKMCETSYTDTERWNSETNQYETVGEDEITYKSGLSGLYITSMSRHLLLTTIKKLVDNGCTFLYADTDSILFVPAGSDSWDFIEIDRDKLGCWSVEAICNRFFYNGKRKKYIAGNTLSPEQVWPLLNDRIKDIAVTKKELPKKLKKKIALSGFSKDILGNLSWKELEELYDDETNMKVIRGKKSVYIDTITRKRKISFSDADINPGKKTVAEIRRDDKGIWRIEYI